MKAPEEKRRYWSAMIARYERSGLSQSRFAADVGVGEAIFRYWLYKHRREGAALIPVKSAAGDEVRLVPVQVRRPGGGTRVDVRIAGVRFLVPVGTDPAYVAHVAVALRKVAAC